MNDMDRKIGLLMVIIMILSLIAKAQDKNSEEMICLDCTVQKLIESKKLVINTELIQNIQGIQVISNSL